MGTSASVLSLPAATSVPGAATAIAGAAGCFALGYLLALSRLPRHGAAPASGGLSDEDSEGDSEEDDDENSGRSRTAKRAVGRKRTGLRLLFWARNVVTKSDSAREAERAQGQTAASSLEVENLAEIIEDFKMVLVVRNDLKMGKGKIAAQCSMRRMGQQPRTTSSNPYKFKKRGCQESVRTSNYLDDIDSYYRCGVGPGDASARQRAMRRGHNVAAQALVLGVASLVRYFSMSHLYLCLLIPCSVICLYWCSYNIICIRVILLLGNTFWFAFATPSYLKINHRSVMVLDVLAVLAVLAVDNSSTTTAPFLVGVFLVLL